MAAAVPTSIPNDQVQVPDAHTLFMLSIVHWDEVDIMDTAAIGAGAASAVAERIAAMRVVVNCMLLVPVWF